MATRQVQRGIFVPAFHFLNIFFKLAAWQCFCAERVPLLFCLTADLCYYVFKKIHTHPEFPLTHWEKQSSNFLHFYVTFVTICHHLSKHTLPSHMWCMHMIWAWLFLSVGFLNRRWYTSRGHDLSSYWGLLNQKFDSSWGSEMRRRYSDDSVNHCRAQKIYYCASFQSTMQTDWYPLLCKQMIKSYYVFTLLCVFGWKIAAG